MVYTNNSLLLLSTNLPAQYLGNVRSPCQIIWWYPLMIHLHLKKMTTHRQSVSSVNQAFQKTFSDMSYVFLFPVHYHALYTFNDHHYCICSYPVSLLSSYWWIRDEHNSKAHTEIIIKKNKKQFYQNAVIVNASWLDYFPVSAWHHECITPYLNT